MKKTLLLLVFAGFMLFASASDLIKINVKDPAQAKKYFTTESLRVNYSCNEFIIATAESPMDFAYTTLNKNAWTTGDNFYVLWTNAQNKSDYLTNIGKYIEILDQTDHYLIVKVKDKNVTKLFPSIHGGVVRINNIAIKEPKQTLSFLKAPRDVDPFVTQLINMLHVNYIQTNVQHLQDYGTRNCLTSQSIEAQNWIKSIFEGYGLNVTLQNFTVNGQNSSANVIATLPGTKFPDQYVVLGGHYDSYSYSGDAPGADDNASGASSVIEIARILSQYTFDRSIIFICFSGEEYGLYGSEAYASMAQSQGMNILGYFNTDMCGYLYTGEVIHTDMIAPSSAEPLVQFYKDVTALYLPDFPVDDGTLIGGDSDHTSFNNHGYMGIFPFEDSQHESPYIHTSNDLIGPSVNSFPMVGKFAQATIASVATMANLLSAPQNLRGIPGNNSATLAWDSLSETSYYRIYKNDGLTPYDSTVNHHYTDTLVTNGTAYTYYVTAIDSASGKETPKSNTVTVMPMAPMTLPFTDNFETGAPYWQFDDTWGISTEAAYSPSHSISESPVGQYGNNKDITAVLGPFSLAGCTDASTSFWTKYTFENNHDFMYFQISTDGQNWLPLDQFTGTLNSWTQKTYSLHSYLNNANVWLRFRFTSDQGTVRQGMFIDDFALTVATTGYSLNGTITYPNASQTPLQGLTVKLKNSSGNVIATTTTDLTGNFLFSNVANGNYTMEVNSSKPWDGVTATDVLLYRKHIANITPLSGIFLNAGDVNASGDITAADVLLLRKRIANIISSFSVGDWLYDYPIITINGSNVSQNFYGIAYGDANGSYIPVK